MSGEGITNFYKVSDVLYRGAKPTIQGFKTLEGIGVKSIIDLRALVFEQDEISSTGLRYFHVNFKTWHPEEEDVVRFLKIVTDPANQPVFVHCQYGSDRTGMMVAVYRIVVQGWSKDEAIQEMVVGGFGFHLIWENLITFLVELDVKDLHKRLH